MGLDTTPNGEAAAIETHRNPGEARRWRLRYTLRGLALLTLAISVVLACVASDYHRMRRPRADGFGKLRSVDFSGIVIPQAAREALKQSRP